MKLTISESKRNFCLDGAPFFWLGDTAWLLFSKLTFEESCVYLQNRAQKGFNVIQATLVHKSGYSTIDGKPALTDDDFSRPAAPEDANGYWEHVRNVVRYAKKLGLIMALLPSWGNFAKDGKLNVNNAGGYAAFLAEYFAEEENILWLVGGDVRGDAAPEVFRIIGKTLKARMPETLVGYHPFGRCSSSYWFHDEPWLDFNMFQSGHRRYDQVTLGAWDDNRLDAETYFGEDNWRYVDRDLAREPLKPTVDGEPSYEQILQGLHDLSQPYWREWDVRRYAYWSVFQGAMGHTYGDNSIQQFFHTPTIPGSFGVRYTWQDALHHVGSEQMGILRDLMESVDYQSGRPATELLVSPQGERYHRISVFAGADFLFAYDYLGEAFTLSLAPYAGRKLTAGWFNPVSGRESFLADVTGKDSVTVKPVARFTPDNDWVLVIRAE